MGCGWLGGVLSDERAGDVAAAGDSGAEAGRSCDPVQGDDSEATIEARVILHPLRLPAQIGATGGKAHGGIVQAQGGDVRGLRRKLVERLPLGQEVESETIGLLPGDRKVEKGGAGGVGAHGAV